MEPLRNKELSIDIEKKGEAIVLTLMPARS
jgi:hypothetical protein